MTQIMIRLSGLFTLTTILFAHDLSASESFQYPELVVAPHASERIQMESKMESENPWMTHIPVQVSGLSTLVASLMIGGATYDSRDPNGYARLSGMVVGAGWLAATAALTFIYHPYRSAERELEGMPAKTDRERLVRERMAEESIESAARLGQRLMWFSVLTNAGASGYMTLMSGPMTMGGIASIGATVLSLAPVVFQYRWQRVACDQRQYKKKIYGPIAHGGLVQDPWGTLSPGIALSYRF